MAEISPRINHLSKYEPLDIFENNIPFSRAFLNRNVQQHINFEANEVNFFSNIETLQNF